MARVIDSMERSVRPSQLIGVFGPGAIYDNLKDSMLILGTDYWDPNGFKQIEDPYLISHIKGSAKGYLSRLKYFISASSPMEKSGIPAISFPSLGVCPKCHMLQSRRGRGVKGEFDCVSEECRLDGRSYSGTPRTVPVRFMSVCENGHIDNFPFYEWVHAGRTGATECTTEGALLYLEDRGARSPSLDSKFVACRSCGLKRSLGRALTRTGIEYVTRRRCRGQSPWLKSRRSENCELFPSGILKGASNVYFPITKSAITIPPFSDELSREIRSQMHILARHSARPLKLKQALEVLFDVKSEDNQDGKYSMKQALEKYRLLSRASSEGGQDIFELEFAQLGAGQTINDEEFKMRPVPKLGRFGAHVDQVAQVEKLRQVVSIMGFTRIHPPNGAEVGSRIASISSEPPEWLPATENRGEGIFLSINQEKLRLWENLPDTTARIREVAGPVGSPEARTMEGKVADARYVLLHTLSHMLIRSLSDLAGYSASSMRERIYSSGRMAGILIFTSSPSSDGSLGGLAEQGGSNFDQVLQRAVERSRSCSSDPLCSLHEPGGAARHGAACHTCTLLAEPACESMNRFLDRATVHSTLSVDSGGFFST